MEDILKAENDKVTTGLVNWIIRKFILLIKATAHCLMQVEILYYLAYGILAVVGVSIHPFFFAFHLTQILLR